MQLKTSYLGFFNKIGSYHCLESCTPILHYTCRGEKDNNNDDDDDDDDYMVMIVLTIMMKMIWNTSRLSMTVKYKISCY